MAERTLDKSLSEIPSESRLDSWKEIALYLHRDVTTVQRWEKLEGMPIHRHQHHKRGSVYALSSELDAWRQSRKLRLDEAQEPVLEAPADPDGQQTTVPPRRRWFALSAAAVVFAALLMLAYVAARSRAGDASRPKIRSLAVLPLQNLSGDPSQDFIAACSEPWNWMTTLPRPTRLWAGYTCIAENRRKPFESFNMRWNSPERRIRIFSWTWVLPVQFRGNGRKQEEYW